MKIGSTIYFDHQATTPVDYRVLAEMMPLFCDSFGNPHSSDHSLGWESACAIDEAAARVARLVGADADEVVFTSGATESNNLALLGLGRRLAGGKRRRILMSAVEHKSVLFVGRVLSEQCGFTVESIPVGSEGFVELSALDAVLDDDVLVVSVLAVNNEIGTIQDIARLSGLIRSCGAVFHCDAAQAPVAMSIEEIALYSDIVSLSAHKMYGPKGIGAVCVSRQLQDKIEPVVYGGGQQNGLRSGTVPVPLCVGMGAAANLLAGGDADERRAELRRRTDMFVDGLKGLSWPIAVNGPMGSARHPGNASIRFVGFEAHDILSALQPRLAASTGSACTSGIPEPSHVLRAIGLDQEEAESSVRFSLGFSTSDEDVDEAVGLIQETLARLSKAQLVQGIPRR
ncbi:MAG: cysteine desulfurase [Acidobacteria bacterium]|nr:cysteine desulfurase [Acidobacteriota bacterium]MYJ02859.1 cysteine desulfurase [Acidobacteriota bacterium]